MPDCNVCGYYAESWAELAEHVLKPQNKSSHAKSLKFALSLKTRMILYKPADQSRIPLTEQEKENKIDSQRALSGIGKTILAICPACKRTHPIRLEKEYLEDSYTWHISSKFAVNCLDCRK